VTLKALLKSASLSERRDAIMSAKSMKVQLPRTEIMLQRLLHESEVRRIELEMQNADLREARDKAETTLWEYELRS
jgi:hypothetical protein